MSDMTDCLGRQRGPAIGAAAQCRSPSAGAPQLLINGTVHLLETGEHMQSSGMHARFAISGVVSRQTDQAWGMLVGGSAALPERTSRGGCDATVNACRVHSKGAACSSSSHWRAKDAVHRRGQGDVLAAGSQ